MSIFLSNSPNRELSNFLSLSSLYIFSSNSIPSNILYQSNSFFIKFKSSKSRYLLGIIAISSFSNQIKAKSFNISFDTFIFLKLASVTTKIKSKLITVARLIISIHAAKSATNI